MCLNSGRYYFLRGIDPRLSVNHISNAPRSNGCDLSAATDPHARWQWEGCLHRHRGHVVSFFYEVCLIILGAEIYEYVPSQNLSRPDRIVPIAERFGMDAGAVLDNVRLSYSIVCLGICLNVFMNYYDYYLICEKIIDYIREGLHVRAPIQPAAWPCCQDVRRALQALGE